MMSNDPIPDADRGPDHGPGRLLIGGAGLAALLSASCCVLPIGLTLMGLGGSWLTMLGPFVAWRGPILGVVAVLLLWAAWRMRHSGRRGARVILGLSVLSFLAALSAPLWEAEAARAMLLAWRGAP